MDSAVGSTPTIGRPGVPGALGWAAGAGLGYALVEAATARARGWPLDPAVAIWSALALALGLGLLHAGLAAALSRWSARAAAVLPAALWAAVWAPEAARAAGLPAALGALAPLAFGLAAWRAPLVVLLGLLGGLAIPLARPSLEGPAGPAGEGRGGANLLLVTVDTVRADAGLLDGPYAPGDPRAPEAGLSRAALAIAPAPWTLPSMFSLMSGLTVAEHGGGLPAEGGFSAPARRGPWLAERLRAGGYETVAVVSNPHLRANLGFAEGFSRWMHDDDAREPLLLLGQLARWRERLTGRVSALRQGRDERLLRAALAELARPVERPRFLWVHLLGPHEYRRAPERPPEGWSPETNVTPVLQQAYAGNVAAARARLGALLAAAPGWGVAITADHGEAFGEGGHQGHGHALQDAELAVPLGLRPPGAREGRTLAGPLGTVDLAHTMLGWVGLADGFPGRDLLAAEPAPVVVGGVRREAGAFAVRGLDGRYTPITAERAPGPARAFEADQRRALEALGYQD